MIGFNTILSLSDETSAEDFLSLCREWMEKSPHTSLKLDSVKIEDGLKYVSENETLEFACILGSEGTHCGVRHTKKDSDCEWRTDVIGFKTSVNFVVSIITSKADFNVSTYSKMPTRPHIVKLLMEKTPPIFDDDILVQKEPKAVGVNNYHELVSIIKNEKKNKLPVVFISKYFSGEYLINPAELAKWLSGFAHVYYETESTVSNILKESTNGLNSYNGSVGIYWPGGSRNYYYSNENVDHILKLRLFVQKTLSSRTLLKECRWSYIQDIKYKKRLDEYRKNNTEMTEFMEYTFNEIKILKDRVDTLESENEYLTQQVEILTDHDFSNKSTLLIKGEERELFKNEQLEFILDLLQEKISSGSCSMRMKNVIESILSSNNRTNNKDEFLKSIKQILVSDRGLNKQDKKELKRLGFDVEESGKHYKLVYQMDDRYSFIVPKSPSDYRGPKNNFSQFKEYFFSV
ncbi:hypothetical protein ACFTRD_03865 [Paenibacillus sp. NPDC056933]|uniref:hypothetical protein n=1 Tax=Paenibacillus sp. NPDC056933 TaxID=3345968 RepID=UPI003634BCF9